MPYSKNILEYYEIKVDDIVINSFELFSPIAGDGNLPLSNKVVLKMKFDVNLAGKNVKVSIKDSSIKNITIEKGSSVDTTKPYPPAN